MDLLKKAHELSKIEQKELLKILLEKYPELSKEIEYNLKHYGTPLISSTQSALWQEELPKKLEELLYKELAGIPVEIKIYPDDADLHHWSIEYNVLKMQPDGTFIKAIDYERNRKEE